MTVDLLRSLMDRCSVYTVRYASPCQAGGAVADDPQDEHLVIV